MFRLQEVFKKGTDIIVLYSGGKDSTYTLLKLYESGLFNIHVLTFDNSFLKKEVKDNVTNFTFPPNIVHQYIFPNITVFKNALRTCYKKFKGSNEYLSFFKRNGIFCWPCFSFLYDSVYKYAQEHNIKYIFGGWNPGQIDEGKHKTEDKGQIPFKEVFNAYVLPFISFLQSNNTETSTFNMDIDDSIKIVPYFFFETYDKNNIISYILENGWIEPENCESCTSNCNLNQADRFLYRSFFGFDRYELQIQRMIEKGLSEPEKRLQVHEEPLDEERVNIILNEIA